MDKPILEVALQAVPIAPVSWQASRCDGATQISVGQPLMCLDSSVSMGVDSSDDELHSDGAAMDELIQQASRQLPGGHTLNLSNVLIYSLDCPLDGI